jgi:hypothetical protein
MVVASPSASPSLRVESGLKKFPVPESRLRRANGFRHVLRLFVGLGRNCRYVLNP